MQQFNYIIKDSQGQTKKGVIESVDSRQASSILHDRGYVVIKIEVKKKDFEFHLGGIGLGPIANFTRQLATMISSGLPLTDSLVILEKQTESDRLKVILKQLEDDI